MLIIADSSALIALAVCQCLDVLDALFEQVRVPQAVFDEVVIEGKPGAETLRQYLQGKVLHTDLREFIIEFGWLGRGELEAMALYKRLHADLLLLDEQRARKVARLNGIQVIGSQGVLLRAKEKGIVTALKPMFDKLEASDIRISQRLIQNTLRLAGEV